MIFTITPQVYGKQFWSFFREHGWLLGQTGSNSFLHHWIQLSWYIQVKYTWMRFVVDMKLSYGLYVKGLTCVIQQFFWSWNFMRFTWSNQFSVLMFPPPKSVVWPLKAGTLLDCLEGAHTWRLSRGWATRWTTACKRLKVVAKKAWFPGWRHTDNSDCRGYRGDWR